MDYTTCHDLYWKYTICMILLALDIHTSEILNTCINNTDWRSVMLFYLGFY